MKDLVPTASLLLTEAVLLWSDSARKTTYPPDDMMHLSTEGTAVDISSASSGIGGR